MKIKILQVLPELNTGEIELDTVELAKFLVQSGHGSYVLSNGGTMVETLEKNGSKHIRLPVHKKSLFSFSTVFKIQSLLLKERFDIIHLRSRIAAWFVYKACEKLPLQKRPKIVTAFNGYYSVDIYSKLMTQGAASICPSKSVKNFALDNHQPINKKALKVIYKGIDTKAYPYGFKPNSQWLQEWADENPSLNDQFILTLAGNISVWKGHSDFLHILYYLKQDGIPIHGLVVAPTSPKDAEYFSRLKNNIRKLGLSDDITILLNRKDLPEIMAISDIVISCSIMPEAFDKTSLMALSLGVPLIAYSHGVLKEHQKALYPYGMIEPGKKSTMRLKIREFYRLRDKPKPFKNEIFSKNQAHSQILSIYEKLLTS